MAIKENRDDPNATWLSRRFGKHAPSDSASKAAYEGFISAYGERDKEGKFRRVQDTFTLFAVPIMGAAMLSMGLSEPEEIIITTLTPPPIEQSIDLVGNHGFSYQGQNYFLVDSESGYRLWEETENTGTYSLITDVEDAYFIVENFQENLSDYIKGMTYDDHDLPEEKPEFILNQTISMPYSNGEENSLFRDVTSSEAFTPSITDAYDSFYVPTISDFQTASNWISGAIQGAKTYNTIELEPTERETITETKIEEQGNTFELALGSAILGLMGLQLSLGTGSAIGGAVGANRRRKKKQQPKQEMK